MFPRLQLQSFINMRFCHPICSTTVSGSAFLLLSNSNIYCYFHRLPSDDHIDEPSWLRKAEGIFRLLHKILLLQVFHLYLQVPHFEYMTVRILNNLANVPWITFAPLFSSINTELHGKFSCQISIILRSKYRTGSVLGLGRISAGVG